MNPRQIHDKVMNAFRDATKKTSSSSSHHSSTSSKAGKRSKSLSPANQPTDHFPRSGKRKRVPAVPATQSAQVQQQQQHVVDPYLTLSSTMFPQSGDIRQQEFSTSVLPLNVLSNYEPTNASVAMFYLPTPHNIPLQAIVPLTRPDGSSQYGLPFTQQPIPSAQLSESSLRDYRILNQLQRGASKESK